MDENNNPFANLKILRYVERISELKQGKNPPPINVSLDLTYGCGHRCKECTGDPAWKALLKNKELLDIEFKEIFNQLKDYGVLSITFVGGGDTMTRANCEDLIAYAYEIGLDVGLLTNGQIMSEEQALKLLQVLSFVRISLDASDPLMFKETHGMEDPKEFYKVLDNTRRLVRIKNKIKSECVIGVSYLTKQSTLRGMIDATKICKDIGVDYIQFKPYREDCTLIDKELQECKKMESDSFKVFGTNTKYEPARRKEKKDFQYCYAQQFFTQIDPNGDITVCCDHKGNSRMVIGNLGKNTFKEIWESNIRKKIVDSINLERCPLYCRGHPINIFLEKVMTEQKHESFL